MSRAWLMCGVLAAGILGGPDTAWPRSKAHRAIPRFSPATWLSDGDYPALAVDRKLSGTTAFTLTIDKDGYVEACAISQSSGVALLDETACAMIRARARFVPEADAAGKPVVGQYSGRITWRLPGDGNATDAEAEQMAAMADLEKEIENSRKKMESFASEISVTVEADGSMSDCEQRFEGAAAARFTPFRCKDMKVGLPFLDETGKAVAKRMTMRYAFSLDDPPDASAAAPSLDAAKPKVPSN